MYAHSKDWGAVEKAPRAAQSSCWLLSAIQRPGGQTGRGAGGAGLWEQLLIHTLCQAWDRSLTRSYISPPQYAFQDDDNMFMVLDLMLGGDLRFHLERGGNMKEDVVRFYIAELSVALDYLHKLQIVHRDLKPDNVLLDEKGHAHLTDFNIAVHFNPRRPLTSIAGSMAYMAPEVLSKRGYLSGVDWWSLGVMAYELLFGRRPFRGKTNSALTHSILNDRCAFPDNVETIVSWETISCIRGVSCSRLQNSASA